MNNNLLAVSEYKHDEYSAYQVGGKTIFLYRNNEELGNHGAIPKMMHDSIRVVAQSGVSSVFNGNQAQVDFLPPIQGKLDTWELNVFELTIVNNDAANPATLLPAQFIINYIEVLVSGSNIVTHYNHHLMYELLYTNCCDEDIQNYQSFGGYVGGFNGTPYAASITIPAAGTVKLYIRFYPCFSREDLYLNNISSQVTYRLHFDSTGMLSTSAASGITLTNIDLLLGGIVFEESIQRKLTNRYRSFDHLTGYSEPQRLIVSGQSISSTTKSNVRITEFNGMWLSHLVVFLVPSGATKENLYNFAALTKLDLLVNGNTVSSYQDQGTEWIRLQMYKFFDGLTSPSTNNIYVISHSTNPRKAIQTGQQSGMYMYSPNCVLEIQAVTAGQYDVYVLGYRFDNLILKTNGTLERIVA